MLARKDVEVHLHAQTKTEHFWLCVWTNHHLEKLHLRYETTPKPHDALGYLKCPCSHWQ